MSVFAEVIKELIGMFIADRRLALSIFILVAVVALLASVQWVEPVFCGSLLLFGCLVILIEAVLREARNRRKPEEKGR